MSKDFIELTPKEVEKLYHFAMSRVSHLVLSANNKSLTYKKAMKVFKGNDKKSLIQFIDYYNKLKTKP